PLPLSGLAACSLISPLPVSHRRRTPTAATKLPCSLSITRSATGARSLCPPDIPMKLSTAPAELPTGPVTPRPTACPPSTLWRLHAPNCVVSPRLQRLSPLSRSRSHEPSG